MDAYDLLIIELAATLVIPFVGIVLLEYWDRRRDGK